jgi:hypothetical protein
MGPKRIHPNRRQRKRLAAQRHQANIERTRAELASRVEADRKARGLVKSAEERLQSPTKSRSDARPVQENKPRSSSSSSSATNTSSASTIILPGPNVPPISHSPGPNVPPISHSPGPNVPPISNSPGPNVPPISHSPGPNVPPISNSPGPNVPPISHSSDWPEAPRTDYTRSLHNSDDSEDSEPEYEDSDFGYDPEDRNEEEEDSERGEEEKEKDEDIDDMAVDAMAVDAMAVDAMAVDDDEELPGHDAHAAIDVDSLQPGQLPTLNAVNQEKQRQLEAGLVRLFGEIGTNTLLGVFAESILPIDELYYLEAAALEVPSDQVTLGGGILTRALKLAEIIALQCSSPKFTDTSSWLNDNLIEILVHRMSSQIGVAPGAYFLDPAVTSLHMHPYIARIHGTPENWTTITVERLLDYQKDPNFTSLHIPEGTTFVVSVLIFPGHWTMFIIDSATATIKFIDSKPDPERTHHVSQTLVPFARLCAKVCGWTVWR